MTPLYYRDILANPIARKVKLADVTDNMNIARLGPEISDRDVARLRKYRRALARLTDELQPNN